MNYKINRRKFFDTSKSSNPQDINQRKFFDTFKSSNLQDIKGKIVKLSEEMDNKQKKLKKLISKFYRKKAEDFIMLDLSETEDIYWKTIKSFNFSQNSNSDAPAEIAWKCKYIHETNNFISTSYGVNSDSDYEFTLVPCFKKTRVSFGYMNRKYYIRSCSISSDSVNVYTIDQLPRLYSIDYENTCDQDTMDDIMKKYSINYNIPEWMMIRFFLQISRHKFYPKRLKKYFKIL